MKTLIISIVLGLKNPKIINLFRSVVSTGKSQVAIGDIHRRLKAIIHVKAEIKKKILQQS